MKLLDVVGQKFIRTGEMSKAKAKAKNVCHADMFLAHDDFERTALTKIN